MDSIKQYIDLYRDNRKAVDLGSAPAMNRLRDKAAEVLANTSLPRKGDEGYARTDVNNMFAPDFGVNLNRLSLPADPAASWRCDVPNMSTLLGIVSGDAFIPSTDLANRLPEGVTFGSLRAAALDNPQLIEKYYGSVAPVSDPAVALNTMLAQDGVFIHIARGVKLAKPLQLINIFSAPAPMLSPRRVLVVMEEGAEAQVLVCDHTQNQSVSYLSSEVIEIILNERSRLDYYNIEESSAATSRHSQMFVRQLEGSALTVNSSTLTCGRTRNSFAISTEGYGCETHLAGMAIASAEMCIDNSVNLMHLAPHCTSSQLFKYVADDRASCAFQGRILVDGQAPFTDARQTCRSVLASPDARMHSEPQLEIYNDEVKCSHGATTGQLDQEALFYMRTRGIPESEARTMLMQAFMADVIDTVRMEGLRDRLRHLVEKRFSGAATSCADCHSACKERSAITTSDNEAL